MGSVDAPNDRPHDNGQDSTFDFSQSAHVVHVGEQIGHYKLLSVLGEGGFGIVYLAQQREPVRRKVALKIIKPGMDSRHVIARFEAEQQALAVLDHPSIAHVFDAGTTEGGRPYFVMEYVRGIPVTAYCDQARLTIDDRLKLFVQICDGVQHAHQKGIIHRDLKPSNILVCECGGDNHAKIIDFGVAKALGQPLTDRTLFTEQGQFIGTPEYMSPEQAGASIDSVDTRSDIYSLGVILYQLLTGTLPFTRDILKKAGLAGIQRTIRETDPPRPSTKLSSMGEEAKTIAGRRNTQLSALTKRLHRELEWIPLKAMRKEPERRYKTVSEFADDMRNYLRGDLLIAGPESAIYRFRKTMKRHQALVTGVIAVLIVLLIGIIASAYFALQSRQAKEVAVVTGRKAQSDYVDQLVESGFLAHKQSNPAEAALWFSSAARESESKLDDPEQVRVNRLRAYAWLQQAPLPISAFQAKTEPYRLLLSGDGNLLLIEDRLHRFTLWDVQQSRQVQLPFPGVCAAAFDPNGVTLAVGGTKGQVQLLGRTQLSDPNIIGLEEPIRALSFNLSGNLLAFGGASVRVWNLETSQFLEGDITLGSPAAYLVFDHDSDHLVAVDANNNLVLAKLTKNRVHVDPTFPPVKHTVDTKSWGVNPCLPCITPTGQLIVRHPLNTLESYQLDGGDRVWRLELKGPITSLSVSSDGRWTALGRDHQLELWKTGESKATHIHSGKQHFAVASSINSTNSLLAHGGYNRAVQVWNLDQEGHRKWIIRHQSAVVDLVFASQNPDLLATAQRDGLVRVWQLPREVTDRKVIVGASEHAVVRSWDGKYIMPGGNYYSGRLLKTTQVHEVASCCPAGPPLRPGGLLNGCAFAPEEYSAVTLSTLPAHTDRTNWSQFDWEHVPGVVTFWNWKTGQKQGPPIQTPTEPIGAEFLPDGKRLIVVCAAGQVLVVDSENHEILQSMDHKARAVPVWTEPRRWLTVCPDASKFATIGLGNWDRGPYIVRVWDPNSGQAVCAVEHKNWVYDASFSPDGKWLATASTDNTARIWNASSGEEIVTLRHPYWVRTVEFDKSSQKLLTACIDGSARLWDWKSGRIEQEYVHHDEVANAKFAMNESVVCTVSRDATLSFWSRSNGRLLVPPRKLSTRSDETYAEYLEIGAEGKDVITNGNSIYFDIFRVPDATSIDEQTPANMQVQRLAQLCTGYSIQGEETANLTSQIWLEEWDSLKRGGVVVKVTEMPDTSPRSPGQVKNVEQGEYEAGVSFLKNREFVDAIASFTRVLEENQKFGSAYYQRAICFLSIRYDNMALVDLNAAIRHRLAVDGLYDLRALCYLRLGRPEEALADYFRSRDLSPPGTRSQKRYSATRLLTCASRVGDRGDLADAIRALDLAATGLEEAVENKDPVDSYNLACVYSLLAEYESRLCAPERHIGELVDMAIAALQRSAEYGYSDVAHAYEDRDLRFVRLAVGIEKVFGPLERETESSIIRAVPEENLHISEALQTCVAHFHEIHGALIEYQKENGSFPDWLSDLVPKYLPAEALLCPNDPAHTSRYSPDPRLPCSYGWEFSVVPAPQGWDPEGKTLWRDWKEQQVKYFGDVVPIIRCYHHGNDLVLNLSRGGQIYWSPLIWETLFRPNYRFGDERPKEPVKSVETGRPVQKVD